jgi:hypothetical protein
MTLTPEYLAELKRLCNEATKGPWKTEGGAYPFEQHYESDGEVLVIALDDCDVHPIADCSCNHTCRSLGEPEANALFIAAAREALPALIAEVERLIAQATDRDFSLLEDAKALKNRAATAEAERDRLRAAQVTLLKGVRDDG